MIIDIAAMEAMTGSSQTENLSSMLGALHGLGDISGLEERHRLAALLGEVGEESDEFRYVREMWGPTKAQEGYEGRADLGNTQPGDGFRFRGGGLIETTGRYNYRVFSHWAAKRWPGAPDFERFPMKIAQAPWSGLSALWYWDTHGCNAHCDAYDLAGLTHSINGGLTGQPVRLARIARAGLWLLGRDPADIRAFQAGAALKIDGIPGPRTCVKILRQLRPLPTVSFGEGAL